MMRDVILAVLILNYRLLPDLPEDGSKKEVIFEFYAHEPLPGEVCTPNARTPLPTPNWGGGFDLATGRPNRTPKQTGQESRRPPGILKEVWTGLPLPIRNREHDRYRL